jgi:UDP-perosamine 4-acetyltransferase
MMPGEESIVLVGGGRHCKVVLSIILENNIYKNIHISDLSKNIGKEILGFKIDSSDNDLLELFQNGVKQAFVTMGELQSIQRRIELFKTLGNIGFQFPTIISNGSYIQDTVTLGAGTVVMAGVIINVDTKIDKNCIINTGAIIDHDCHIGAHTHLAPGVTLSGSVEIGMGTHIGTGASIIDGITIADHVIVGAGAVVIDDVPSNSKVAGVPAKKI